MTALFRAKATGFSTRQLAIAQAVSGLYFACFLLLHLMNTAVSTFGPGLYEAVQRPLQAVYQHPVVEITLLVSVIVHIAAGLTRWRQRVAAARQTESSAPAAAKSRRRPITRAVLHRLAGYVLLLVIGAHVLATRGPSLVYGIEVGFSGPSFTVQWLPEFFYPYYILFGICGLGHALWGSVLSLRLLGISRVRLLPQVLPTTLIVGSVLIVLGLLSFGGAFYDVPNALDSEFGRLYLEMLGVAP